MAAFGVLSIHAGQWLFAYLALDLCFRTIPLDQDGLQERLRAYQIRFTLLAAGFALAGACAQLSLAGLWGGAPGLLGWVPWWILWRFGWRKQLTFLYKDDGGYDIIGTTKPDP